jgi:tRNA (cmo5U34)-methyltransferase
MSAIWDASTYDEERRRLIPCFDAFYDTAAEMVARACSDRESPRFLDLGAGTGLLSCAILARLPRARAVLLDASSRMLDQARSRLSRFDTTFLVQAMTDALPEGPFDAVVSSLAIHHLDDDAKRSLYARARDVLAPGGLFVNAEQVSGGTPRLDALFLSMHLDVARDLGSSLVEIARAVDRMRHDRCATTDEQVRWIKEIGFTDPTCFFQWYGFAVFGGWR